jgi:hypothetical protein
MFLNNTNNVFLSTKIQIITHIFSHVLNYNKPPLKHASDSFYVLQLTLKQ